MLVDFGMSTLRGKTSSVIASSTAGSEDDKNLVQGGTAAYMAPELLDTSQIMKPSADIYSFGVLLVRLLEMLD